MNKKLTILSIVISLISPLMVFAINFPPFIPGQEVPDGGDGGGAEVYIGHVIDRIFGYIWLLFVAFSVIMFIRAGFLFLTAGGEPGKVKSAGGSLVWGMAGLAVAMLAFTIPWIVYSILN